MPRGNQSSLQILPQTNKDTVANTWATASLLPFLSESLKAEVTKYGSQALRRNSQRDKNLVRPGTINVNGGIDFEATNQSLHVLLPLGFKRTAGTETATEKDAIYTPYQGDATYASIKVNDGEVTRLYRGAVLSQMSFSAEVDQLVRLSTTWEGIDMTATAEANAGGALPATEYGLYFEQGQLVVGDAALTNTESVYVKSFSLDINRNATTDRFGLGSRYKRDVPVGVYDITGSIMIDANSFRSSTDKAALFKAALETKMLSLQLTFVDPGNTTGASATPSKFVITIPFGVIDWPDHNISSEDFIMGNVNFTSYAATAPAAVVAGTIPTDQFSIQHVYKI